MAVQVKARLNGGAWNTGGITGALNDVVELQWVDATGITVSRWEIVDYPVGFALPAGWVLDLTDNYTYYNLDPVPPPFTMTPWGKFMCRGTANGGLAIQPDGSLAASNDLIDVGTALSVPSAVAALEDTGSIETTQFHDNGFVAGLKINWRLLEALVGAGILPGADHTLFYSHGGASMWTGAPEVPSVTATSFFLSPAGYVGVGVALPATGPFRMDNSTYLTSTTAALADRQLIGIDNTDQVLIGDLSCTARIQAASSIILDCLTSIRFGPGVMPAAGTGRWANASTQYWRSTAGAAVHGIGLNASNWFQVGDTGYYTELRGLWIEVTAGGFIFDTTVPTPSIGQDARVAGDGADFTITPQESLAAAGGDLILHGGTGATGDGSVVLCHGPFARRTIAAGYEEVTPVAAHATADPAANLLEWYYAGQGWGAGPDVRHIVVPASTYAVGAATDAQHCSFECWHDVHTAAAALINIDYEVGTIAGRTYTGAARDCLIWYKVTVKGYDRNDGATTRTVQYFEGTLQYASLTGILQRMVTGTTGEDPLLRDVRTHTATVTHADLTNVGAGATETENIGTALPIGARILATDVTLTTQFTGGGVASVAMDVGVAGETEALIKDFDAFGSAAPASYDQGASAATRARGNFSSEQIIATFTPDGGHALADLTAGSVTVSVDYSLDHSDIVDLGDVGGPGTFNAAAPPNNHTFRVEFNPSDANDIDWTFHVEMTLWNPGSP